MPDLTWADDSTYNLFMVETKTTNRFLRHYVTTLRTQQRQLDYLNELIATIDSLVARHMDPSSEVLALRDEALSYIEDNY